MKYIPFFTAMHLFAATWIERMGGEHLRWNGMKCQEMIQQDDQMPGCLVILLMEEILHKLRLVVYPIICRVVLYIPGGCLGFQPSTVSSTTWQGSCQSVLMPRGYCSFARKPKGRQRQAEKEVVSSLKRTVRTWKWMVGILLSFWDGLFSGANC